MKRLLQWLLRVLGLQRSPAPPTPDATPKLDIAAHVESVERTGRHYYLGRLLDELPRYFEMMKLLKGHTDLYDVFANLGGQIVSEKFHFRKDGKVEPILTAYANLPSSGMMFYTNVPDKTDKPDHLWPSAFFFRKVSTFARIEHTNLPRFEMGVFYPDPNPPKEFRNVPVLMTFFATIDSDGICKPLRELKSSVQYLPDKSHIVHQRWGVANELTFLAKENNTTPAEITQHLMRMCLDAMANTQWDVRIQCVNRDGICATFSIDMLRFPYFFQDREKTVNHNGRTRRIFHIVRTHFRTLADGREVPVHSHFRGLRHFNWNNYRVSITVPNFHHASLGEFEAGVIVTDDDTLVPGTMDAAEAARLIRKHTENSVGNYGR